MIRTYSLRLSIAAALIALWQMVASLPSISPLIVSSPIDVFRALLEILLSTSKKVPEFYTHLQRTGYEVILAYILVLGFGVLLGVVFGVSPNLAEAYEPLILAYLAFPTIVLFPLIFMVFGSGEASKVAYGFLIGFPYVVFNVAAGVRQVDRDLVVLSRSLGHSRIATIFKVSIPSAIPTIIGGLRLGFAHTFIGVIVGEIINGSTGLGYLLNWTALSFFTPELYSIIIITLSIGVLGDSFFRLTEGRLMRWRY